MIETFRPHEKIKRKKDFLFLYREGNRYNGKYFNLIYFPNNLHFSRMAVIVSKKVGNAVARNKIKRWIRDLFRKNRNLFKKQVDLLIITKKGIQDIPWTVLRDTYLETIETLWVKK